MRLGAQYARSLQGRGLYLEVLSADSAHAPLEYCSSSIALQC
jgi:hypothetical protein